MCVPADPGAASPLGEQIMNLIFKTRHASFFFSSPLIHFSSRVTFLQMENWCLQKQVVFGLVVWLPALQLAQQMQEEEKEFKQNHAWAGPGAGAWTCSLRNSSRTLMMLQASGRSLCSARAFCSSTSPFPQPCRNWQQRNRA